MPATLIGAIRPDPVFAARVCGFPIVEACLLASVVLLCPVPRGSLGQVLHRRLTPWSVSPTRSSRPTIRHLPTPEQPVNFMCISALIHRHELVQSKVGNFVSIFGKSIPKFKSPLDIGFFGYTRTSVWSCC